MPPDGQRCTATANRTGERCERWAVRGATVCPTHGGRAPQVRAAAQRRLATQRGEKKLADWGYEPVEDPFAAMADLAGRALALVDALSSELADGRVDAANVEALGAAIDRAHRQVKGMADTGFEAARLRLEQQRVALDIAIVREVLKRRGVDPFAPEVQADITAVLLELGQATPAADPSPE